MSDQVRWRHTFKEIGCKYRALATRITHYPGHLRGYGGGCFVGLHTPAEEQHFTVNLPERYGYGSGIGEGLRSGCSQGEGLQGSDRGWLGGQLHLIHIETEAILQSRRDAAIMRGAARGRRLDVAPRVRL